MIAIRTESELDLIRQGGEILRDCFRLIEEMLRLGVTTGKLDRVAEEFIRSRGAAPAFKGYQGYPASICTSVNEQVVHGIPGPRKLRDGDIIGIDIGVLYEEFYADASRTYIIGEVDEEAERLIEVTREALELAIDKARPGNHLSDISHVIQTQAEKYGYQVVRALVGHGIGRRMHEEPQIPNFGPPGRGPILKPGMVLALEPMVNAGTYEVHALKDNWTVVTVDGRLSAHFEDTVAVTEDAPRIMTR
jgi:methionyl aminopeptidase